MLINIVKNYFVAFQNKDLSKLQEFFSPTISLKDWDMSAEGFSQVVLAYQHIFNSVNSINVNVLNIYLDGLVVVAEIEIIINGNALTDVADIFKFDNDFKILAIKAYKC